MKPAKYYSSILLRFRSYDRFLYRFADRNEMENTSKELTDRVRNCMIYMICSRPIVAILPDTFKKVEDQYIFDIKFRIGGKEVTRSVKSPKGLIKDFGGKVEVSDYPNNLILNYDADNNLISETLISNLIHLFQEIPGELKNHEVLYIGKGTSDCAIDRLNGHSTLERILADILKDEPYKEMAILLYNFKMQKDVMSIQEIGEKAEIRADLAKKHFEDILQYKPGIEEQTEIAEALLINYFKTAKYNIHFTQGLSSNMTTLKNVYTMDFDAVVVEVDNENIGYLNIFSEFVKPNYNHQALLDIRKEEGRVSIFEMK